MFLYCSNIFSVIFPKFFNVFFEGDYPRCCSCGGDYRRDCFPDIQEIPETSNISIDISRYIDYVRSMDKVQKFIQALGFPIAMCIFLLYIIFVTLNNNTSAILDLTSFLKSNSVSFSERSLSHD